MKKYFPLLFLLFVLSKSQGQNLIVNSGFESGLTAWVPFSTNATYSTETISSNNPQSGTSCGKISIFSPATVSAGALQHISVTPLQHYLLEYYVRVDSVSGLVFPYLNFGDTSVNYEYGLMPVNSSTGWQHFQSRFTIPAGNNNDLVLFLIFSGTNGSAYFDNLSLTRVTDTTFSNFSIDITGSAGIIKNFLGTNTGPVKLNGPVNLTGNFQETGINYVRTHDYYGACDISTIFPDTTKSAGDSSAYNFSSSDSVIAATINAGSKILFRLGESFEAVPVHNIPPADMNKWADICLQIEKHYNEGWDHGFHYNIKEWEIWNEPDGPAFWAGTATDFVKLYRLTATKLKQHDNSLQIGGPAIASIFSTGFLNTFLDSVSTENLPLDFFSYHFYYIANPYHFKYADSLAKTLLAHYGLSSAKRYVTEWNPTKFSGNVSQISVWHNHPYISSQAASVMTYWQEDGPDKIFWYRTDEYLFGLFNESTGDYTFPGRAFEAVNNLNLTPFKLPSTGNDNLGRTILAGKSISGDSINILISDNASSKKGYTLNLNNIAGTDSYVYRQYSVITTDSLSMLSSGTVSASNPVISAAAVPPFTDLIKLTKITTTGIRSPGSENSFIVYPNPANEILNISLLTSQKQQVQIFNPTGALLREISVNKTTQIDISDLPCGVYFARLKNQGNETLRFIRQ